jgi:peptidyl-prolyl isomerase D
VPQDPVVITKSGVLEASDPFLTQDDTRADGDKYEDFPEDGDDDVQNPEVALAVAKTIREVGNKLFKEGNARDALLKYQSTLFPSILAVWQLNIRPVQSQSDTLMFTLFYQKILPPLCRNPIMLCWRLCC